MYEHYIDFVLLEEMALNRVHHERQKKKKKKNSSEFLFHLLQCKIQR